MRPMAQQSEGAVAGAPWSPGELEAQLAQSLLAIGEAADLDTLGVLRSDVLGPRSRLAGWRKGLGTIAPEQRRTAGAALNAARDELEAALSQRAETLAERQRAAKLAADRLDLTEVRLSQEWSTGHLHLVTQVREELEDVFVGMGYEIAEGPEVESDWNNFTALNVPPDHPARSNQDSFYLDLGDRESFLLRTQTSPVQIRLLERGVLPLYAVAPGRVYRRDTADARHLPVFHQIEGIVIDRGVTFGDLAGTIATFTEAIFGQGTKSRLRPAHFPFTEPSAEFEITCSICGGTGCRTCGGVGWIELGGAGMVHPAVLEHAGIDPEEWSGFAFGFGIDRLAMMRHEIEDIRSFIENDARFLAQF
ncbi:MAG: phenylalanyl-tRNA synthetase, alpha subunit [Acidimicrobiaceae bacterium]|nr:phenylalanyl-tRNA synthetase, alpha subunit [Acidimicrobiaceae bacterium]